MPDTHHVVVDGSNLATEGRTRPEPRPAGRGRPRLPGRGPRRRDRRGGRRLVQPPDRPPRAGPARGRPSSHGEVVAPPAGAIGRGDAFVLRIAERTGADGALQRLLPGVPRGAPVALRRGPAGRRQAGARRRLDLHPPPTGARPEEPKGEAAETEAVEDELSAPRKAAEVAKALKKAAKAAGPGRAKAGAKAPPAKGRRRRRTRSPRSRRKKAVARPAPGKPPRGRERTDKGDEARRRPRRPRRRSTSGRTRRPPATRGARRRPTQAARRPPAKADRQEGGGRAPAALGIRCRPSTRRPRRSWRRRSRTDRPARAPGPGSAVAASSPPPAVNEPLAFITFVAAHPLGSTVDGGVASFTSHGAMVDVALDRRRRAPLLRAAHGAGLAAAAGRPRGADPRSRPARSRSVGAGPAAADGRARPARAGARRSLADRSRGSPGRRVSDRSRHGEWNPPTSFRTARRSSS